MRKILFILLCVFSVSSFAQIRVQVDDLYYNISGNKATVTSNRIYYSENDYSEIYRSTYRNPEYNIPSYINYNGYDYPVVAIEEGAFANLELVKATGEKKYSNRLLTPALNITLPSTITTIGAYAFYGTYIGEGHFPNVQTIGDYAFAENSSGLTTVSFPQAKIIGNYAFSNRSAIVEMEIPNVESIGDNAFNRCRSIESFSGPRVISLGNLAFNACSKLDNVYLPMVESIGSKAFSSCTKLTSIILSSSLKYLGEENIFSNCDLLRDIYYLSPIPPSNWVATSNTYVPSKANYSSPKFSINDANIMEMITWKNSAFSYSGSIHEPQYVNNIEGYTPTMDFSSLHKDAGEWNDTVTAYFMDNYNGHDFQVKIPYHYTISPLTLTASAQDAARIYGDNNPTFEIKYLGFLNSEDESVLSEKPIASTTATPNSNVGAYPITVSGGSAKNYTLNYKDGVLTVNKAPLSARVVDTSRLYGAENPNFSLSYEGLKNDETAPKWTKSPRFTTVASVSSGVGEYAVNATATPTNYDLTITSGVLTVKPASLVMKAENATRKYYEDDPVFNYTCSGFVNNEDVSVITTQPSFSIKSEKTSDVGTYSIMPYGAISANYAISYEPGILTITPRDLNITAEDKTREYGNANPQFTFTYQGFVGKDDESVLLSKPIASTSATPNSNVGTYAITVSGGSAKNYTLNYKDGVLTVNKAPLSARVVDASRLYGAENPNFSLSYEGLKNDETAPKWTKSPRFTTVASVSSGVGEYAVNATATPTNYDLTITSGVLTVKPASLVMKAENATRKYYEDDPVFNYTCSGFVNNEDVSVITTQPSFSIKSEKTSDVGTYSIMPYGAISANYAISYEPGILTITPRDLNITAEDKTREYGNANPQFTFTYQGFVGKDDESVLLSKPIASTSATPNSNVGTYEILSKGGSAKNYKIHNENGTLTIQKAPLTVYVNDCQKEYGSDNPSFSSVYEGLKNGESQPIWIMTPRYTTEATKSSSVGTYVIKLINGQCLNYDATFVDGSLTIIKARLIVKVENKSRLYYEDNPAFSYQILGLRNTDDASVLIKEPNFECMALLTSKVGTYPINASGAEARNYEIGYEEGELTIMKRTLTVIPIDVTRKYAEKNPELGCIISGFVNNEDNSILLQLPTIYTNASELSDVGTYAIYAKEAMADNYKFNYKQGTLTVEKANQTITWEQEFNDIAVGDQIELLAKSTSGLDIEYMFDTDIVSLYVAGEQQYLDCLADGTFSIRATQKGDKNYNPAVRVAKTITIGNSSGISAIIE